MRLVETDAATILPLRHAVLRPGKPLDDARFPTDDAPGTRHWAAFDGDRLIGCATLQLAPAPGRPGLESRQLRGMAVAEGLRGQGIGARLLEAAEGAALLWCNGRVSAADFYRRHGWRSEGEVFETVAGPHLVFVKPLDERPLPASPTT